MKVWLDDLRPAPDGWVRARTAAEAIALLGSGDVEEVSLDHDLGEEPGVGCGYDVATWIEEQAALGQLAPPRWAVHSANPVGRARMEAALISAGHLWGGR